MMRKIVVFLVALYLLTAAVTAQAEDTPDPDDQFGQQVDELTVTEEVVAEELVPEVSVVSSASRVCPPIILNSQKQLLCDQGNLRLVLELKKKKVTKTVTRKIRTKQPNTRVFNSISPPTVVMLSREYLVTLAISTPSSPDQYVEETYTLEDRAVRCVCDLPDLAGLHVRLVRVETK